MSYLFVSDISSIIVEHLNNQDYESIYRIIDSSINEFSKSTETPDDFEKEYRLQHDIALLNTTLLETVSKYVNGDIVHEKNKKKKTKRDTNEYQTISAKENVFHKYFYMILKLILLSILLFLFYVHLFTNDKNVKSGQLINEPS